MAPRTPSEIEQNPGYDHDIKSVPVPSTGEIDAIKALDPEALEVFQRNVDGVEFRTVSWQRATVVFLKINFAMSILTTPNALATFGAVGGGLSLVAWIILNTCKTDLRAHLTRNYTNSVVYRYCCSLRCVSQQPSRMPQ